MQHVARRSECFRPSGPQDEHFVHAVQHRRAQRYDHRGDLPLLGALQGLGQSLLACGIEIRVGLVENDKARITEESPGERDALLLSPRERSTAAVEHGLVALRQLTDHVVDAREHRRLIDAGVGQIVAHAADVLLDGSGK